MKLGLAIVCVLCLVVLLFCARISWRAGHRRMAVASLVLAAFALLGVLGNLVLREG